MVVFSQPAIAQKQDIQFPLYEEPGLSRVGILDSSSLSGNEWIFGSPEVGSPLIVSARKGDWLRVYYDDAGREAWMNPENKGHFQTWERFLKSHAGFMLPALQPQFYQLWQQPGGKQIGTMTPKQVFKVLKLENSWVMVLTDKSQIGWVRWRDNDERLTIGTGKK